MKNYNYNVSYQQLDKIHYIVQDLLLLPYSELKKNYTTELRLWINTVNDKDEELYLAEITSKDDQNLIDPTAAYHKDWFKDEEYLISYEKKMFEFQKNDEIVFKYADKNIWWAIPSVTKDIEYPYRIYTRD